MLCWIFSSEGQTPASSLWWVSVCPILHSPNTCLTAAKGIQGVLLTADSAAQLQVCLSLTV